MVQIAEDYSKWMAQNDIPKLFVNADPGAILIGAPREFCRSWKNQTEVTVPGSHFIQEDFRAGDRPGGGGVDEGPRDMKEHASPFRFAGFVQGRNTPFAQWLTFR